MSSIPVPGTYTAAVARRSADAAAARAQAAQALSWAADHAATALAAITEAQEVLDELGPVNGAPKIGRAASRAADAAGNGLGWEAWLGGRAERRRLSYHDHIAKAWARQCDDLAATAARVAADAAVLAERAVTATVEAAAPVMVEAAELIERFTGEEPAAAAKHAERAGTHYAEAAEMLAAAPRLSDPSASALTATEGMGHAKAAVRAARRALEAAPTPTAS